MIRFFLLLALLARTLIPDGFMPAPDADGKMRIVICTGQGPLEKWVDFGDLPHNKTNNGHHNENTHPPCPYAPVFLDGLESIAQASLPPFFLRDAPSFSFETPFHQTVLPHAWQARGPPHILS